MDKKLIDKISGYDNEQLLRLEAHTFQARNSNRRSIGFIAQEVAAIEPMAIQTTPQGYLVIDYQMLTVALFDQVKKQQNQLDELKREVISLKNKKGK